MPNRRASYCGRLGRRGQVGEAGLVGLPLLQLAVASVAPPHLEPGTDGWCFSGARRAGGLQRPCPGLCSLSQAGPLAEGPGTCTQRLGESGACRTPDKSRPFLKAGAPAARGRGLLPFSCPFMPPQPPAANLKGPPSRAAQTAASSSASCPHTKHLSHLHPPSFQAAVAMAAVVSPQRTIS